MEQARLLAEHSDAVKQQAAFMRRAIDKNDLKDVLKHAALMVGELRTSSLTPKVYYELYMYVFDNLGTLESYFMQLARGGTECRDIYNAVQQAAHILPRMYLMVTAGSVYVRSGQASAHDVLGDLIECVKGVQHAQRGLFVRYYLVQRMKDKLPDHPPAAATATGAGAAAAVSAAPAASEGDGKGSKVAIDFLVANLVEMNRLWVRMQAPTTGVVRNRKRRERERQELRILVGANLTRLSQLDGLDVHMYTTSVLPKVSAEIISCRDKIAQAYLVEGLLQVFPLEYHIATLGTLLGLLPQLVPDHATLKTVALSLLSRIQQAASIATDGSSTSVLSPKLLSPTTSFVIASKSVLGLPAPPVVRASSSVLPPDVDVFGTILQYISQLALDANGPFRPSGSSSSSSSAPGNAPERRDSDDGDGGGGGGGSGGHSNGAAAANGTAHHQHTPVKAKSGARIAALRDAVDVAVAVQPLSSLLEIFQGLLSFTLSIYPGHMPYVDAVLGASATSLRDLLGLAQPQDPATVTAAPIGEVMDSAAASISDEAKAKLDAVAPPQQQNDAATAGVPSSMTAAAPRVPGGSSGGRGSSSQQQQPVSGGLDETCSTLVVALLSSAQRSLGLEVLDLTHYAGLMAPLGYRYRRDVAAGLLASILETAAAAEVAVASLASAPSTPAASSEAPSASAVVAAAITSSALLEGGGGNGLALVRITDTDTARRLLAALQSLIRDDADDGDVQHGAAAPSEKERFTREQTNMAKLVHLMGPAHGHDDNAATRLVNEAGRWFEVLTVARDFLSWGGPSRVTWTYPALLNEALALAKVAPEARVGAVTRKKVYTFIHELASTVAIAGHTEQAIQLYLQAADGCDDTGFGLEFYSQALLLVEESPITTSSPRQARALSSIIASLNACPPACLDTEAYTTLASRCTQHAARLLKKADQVRLLLCAAHLYWRGRLADAGGGEYHKPREVIACLQRALRTADSILPPSPILFVDVLSSYIYFADKQCASVTAAHISDLVSLCTAAVQHAGSVAASGASPLALAARTSPVTAVVAGAGAGEAAVDPATYLKNTLEHLQTLQEQATGGAFKDVKLPQ